jgi:hypothetical protein
MASVDSRAIEGEIDRLRSLGLEEFANGGGSITVNRCGSAATCLSLPSVTDFRKSRMAGSLVDYPFADRLYAGALEAIKHGQQWGPAAILSDGDAVFQPRKVERSGLWAAFEDRVLIYVHKEQELAEVERLYPAKRYVMIDDKLHILNMVKQVWGERTDAVHADGCRLEPPAGDALIRR